MSTTLTRLRNKRHHNQLITLFKELRTMPQVMFAFFVLVVVGFMAILAPLISPYDPYQLFTARDAPSGAHLLGTDPIGEDVLSRIIWGARITMIVSLTSVLAAFAIGATVGQLSGYYGGKFDDVLASVTDALFAFPMLLLAMILMAALGAGMNNVIIALIVLYTPRFIRFGRAMALSIREQEYVLAAKATGESGTRIIFRHILPNSMAPLIVQMSVCFGGAILNEAALSFLGLGVPPPAPSWGGMLLQARNYLDYPWMWVSPGLAIFLTVICFNLFGDGLRDALDPRLRIIR